MLAMTGNSPLRPFEDLVLTIVGEVLKSEWRSDRVANAILDRDPRIREDPDLHADILIGAADCLLRLTRQPHFSFDSDFDAFADACRAAWRAYANLPQTTRLEHMRWCITTALRALQRK